MKLSLPITIAIALLANESQVAAFTPSKNTHSISFTYAGVQSYKPVSMAAEPETDIIAEDVTVLDFDGVNRLPYRSLQKECKDRGLAANGNTATLRRSLLQDIGLFTPKDEDCVITEGAEVS